MKKLIADLMCQILIDLIFRAGAWLTEWLSVAPWG